MRPLLRLITGLALAASVVGCCYRPGYYDPVTGMAYGGYWEPCCGGPFDPFCLWNCANWWGCCGYGPGYYGYGGWGGANYGYGAYGSSLVSPTFVEPGYVVDPYASGTVYDNGCDCQSQVYPGVMGPMMPSESAEPMPHPQPAPPAEDTTYYQTWPSDAVFPSSLRSGPVGGEVIQEARTGKWLPARF